MTTVDFYVDIQTVYKRKSMIHSNNSKSKHAIVTYSQCPCRIDLHAAKSSVPCRAVLVPHDGDCKGKQALLAQPFLSMIRRPILCSTSIFRPFTSDRPPSRPDSVLLRLV